MIAIRTRPIVVRQSSLVSISHSNTSCRALEHLLCVHPATELFVSFVVLLTPMAAVVYLSPLELDGERLARLELSHPHRHKVVLIEVIPLDPFLREDIIVVPASEKDIADT